VFLLVAILCNSRVGSDEFQSNKRNRELLDDRDIYDLRYKWTGCCDFHQDATKDFGSGKTNFIIPVTTAGPAFGFFEGFKNINNKKAYL
jgi:hypothetical protein